MAHLQQLQVHIAARPRPEMCFTDPRDSGGVFFQWSTFELAVDPRFGGALPAPAPQRWRRRAARVRRRAGRRPRRLVRSLRRTARDDRHLRARRRAPRRAGCGRVARRLHPRPLPPARGRKPCAVGPHLRAGAHAPPGAARRGPGCRHRRAAPGRYHHRALGRRPRRARPWPPPEASRSRSPMPSSRGDPRTGTDQG